MKRRIALVTTAAAFLTVLLAMPAAADPGPGEDPGNFHWTGTILIFNRGGGGR
ncbi:hypothetical protein [Nonomuraea sp. NPDC002799]